MHRLVTHGVTRTAQDSIQQKFKKWLEFILPRYMLFRMDNIAKEILWT